MSGAVTHVPVLVGPVVHHLVRREEGIYIDGTVGGGGHSEAILHQLGPRGKVAGLDRDSDALVVARERLREFGDRVLLLHTSYEDLEGACHALGVSQVDGILVDLGLSSLQLDRPERGFSFLHEGRLDMRMDATTGGTVEELLARAKEETLKRILREYGEEPFAGRIARAIALRRRERPLHTTTDLARLVLETIPRRAWPRKIHPATRTFQALRIAVNAEIERLENFLGKVPDFLRPGGRFVVLSYHSLEDRLAKLAGIRWERAGVMKRVTKKPMSAGEEEIRQNPRSRSAKLRVMERQ